MRRADLSFTSHTVKPTPPHRLPFSLPHPQPPPFSTPFHSAISTSLPLPSLTNPPFLSFFCSFTSPLSLSLPPCHPKLSWSHYFEEKWSVEVRGGGCLLSLSLVFRLFIQDHFVFCLLLDKYKWHDGDMQTLNTNHRFKSDPPPSRGSVAQFESTYHLTRRDQKQAQRYQVG